VLKIDIRKLISFGKNSHIISLPKSWINKNKLKKGDLISVDENKEGLLLKMHNSEIKKEEPKKVIIDVENKSLEILRTEIVSAYLDNYDIIEVVSKDMKTNVPEIRDMLRDLAGLEVINQSSTRIVAKDLININEIKIRTLIRRMDNITRAMINDAVECFRRVDHTESMTHIDEEVNRLHFLAYRIIRSGLKDVRIANSLGANALKLHSDHTVTTEIEEIADNTKRICRYLKDTKLDEKWSDELKQIFNSIRQSYLDVMKAYYTNNIEGALKIEETNKDRIIACNDFFGKHTNRKLKYGAETKKGFCNYRKACGATSRIIENMKEMASSVKYIARTVIGGG